MKLDTILLTESFFLPGCRERLYKVDVALRKKKTEDALKEIVDQRKYLESVLGRKLTLRGKKDYEELVDCLIFEAKPLLNRLQTIRLRAGEIKSKKVKK